MGCFNVACNLTNTSMYCDKALWVPLISSNENGRNAMRGQMFIYPIAVYTPIACPVFGELDSYGRLENIERTPNVEAIERLFEANIDDIIDDPSSFEVPGMKDGGLSSTYISYDAFQWSKKNLFDDGGKNITNLTSSYLTDRVLNICGFKEVSQDSNRKRYNQLYTSERYPGVEWWSDGTWGNWGTEEYCGIYDPIKFLKELEKKTGVAPDPKVLKKLKNSWSFLISVEEKIAKVKEQQEVFGSLPALEGREPYDFGAYERRNLYPCRQEGARWEASDVMDQMYKDNLDLYKEDLANLLHLNTAISINNRFWSPQQNGYQHGSDYMEKALAQWVINKANKSIKERDAENAEFDDEEDED